MRPEVGTFVQFAMHNEIFIATVTARVDQLGDGGPGFVGLTCDGERIWGLDSEIVAVEIDPPDDEIDPLDDDRSAGFVCKKCGGPSPVGVGYIDETDGAYERSEGLTECACGWSATYVNPGSTK